MAVDNNIMTKYLTSGSCGTADYLEICGLNTDFYLTLRQGPSTIIGFQMCTANDHVDRDPTTVTLEGSNESGLNLTLGTSWILIYNGSSGISNVLNRNTWGLRQYFTNSISYAAYPFLVNSKRSAECCAQYAEVQFFEN